MTLEMIALAMELAVAVGFGAFGSFLRMLIQYKRDKQWPTDGLSTQVELLLGASGGFLGWLFVVPLGLRALAIVAVVAGYSAADSIENWLNPG